MWQTTTNNIPISTYVIRQGWQCPACHLILSPDVTSCACQQENGFAVEEPSIIPPSSPWWEETFTWGATHPTSCTVAGCTICTR